MKTVGRRVTVIHTRTDVNVPTANFEGKAGWMRSGWPANTVKSGRGGRTGGLPVFIIQMQNMNKFFQPDANRRAGYNRRKPGSKSVAL